MRIFISADIEGVSGVVSREHASGDKHMNLRMTREVAAAAEGVLRAGADKVVVVDGHAFGDNLLHEELPEKVKLIQGRMCPLGMMESVDKDVDAALFIGYHALKNTPDGVLNHSMSGARIFAVRVNGRTVGETALNAAVAGVFKVPVVLVSGDEAACGEAAEFIEGVRTSATKRGIGMIAAESVHPSAACAAISAEAEAAVRDRGNIKPYTVDGPVKIEADFARSGMADAAAFLPGSVRTGAVSVSWEAADYLSAYRGFQAMLMLSSTFPF